jgi:hypothetical protein
VAALDDRTDAEREAARLEDEAKKAEQVAEGLAATEENLR